MNQVAFAFAAPPPIVTGHDLRGYQSDCLTAIHTAAAADIRRQLIVMATGTGKSRCFSALPSIFNQRMLVLVHGVRLLEQGAQEIQHANPYLTVEIEQADRFAAHDADVVVASIDTVGREASQKRLVGLGAFGLVALDECHRSLGVTWLRALGATVDHGTLLTGWTATPGRGDQQSLANLFDKVVYELPLRRAIEEGHLCRLRAVRIATGISIANVRTTQGDFDQIELVHQVNVDSRNSIICSAIESHAATRRAILVHAINVAHIMTLTQQLADRGHAAEGVHYRLPDPERRAILDRFHTGDTRILVHCGICLEGYNEPRIDCGVFARPSKSSLYYAQALGRATRNHPGKADALIIDIVDLCGRHRVQTAATHFGLRDMDLLGGDIIHAVKRVEALPAAADIHDGDTVDAAEKRLEAQERAKARLRDWLSQRTIKVHTTAETVDLFAAVQPTPKQNGVNSVFSWTELDSESWGLRVDAGRRVVLRRAGDGGWNVKMWNGANPVAGENLCTQLGKIANHSATNHIPWPDADRFVKRFAGTWLTPSGYALPRWRLMVHTAPRWQKAATPAQLSALRARGVPTVPAGTTAGAAQRLLDLLWWRRRQTA